MLCQFHTTRSWFILFFYMCIIYMCIFFSLPQHSNAYVWLCCVSPRAAITTYHKPGGFDQQKCIVSQSWKVEAQYQVSSRAGSLEWWREGSAPGLFPMAYRWLYVSVFLHMVFPLCLSVSKFPFFIRTPITLDYGASWQPSLNWYTTWLRFQIKWHYEVLGFRTSAEEFWGAQFNWLLLVSLKEILKMES